MGHLYHGELLNNQMVLKEFGAIQHDVSKQSSTIPFWSMHGWDKLSTRVFFVIVLLTLHYASNDECDMLRSKIQSVYCHLWWVTNDQWVWTCLLPNINWGLHFCLIIIWWLRKCSNAWIILLADDQDKPSNDDHHGWLWLTNGVGQLSTHYH